LPARRAGAATINKAVAPTLSQNAKSGRFGSIRLESNGYFETTNAPSRGFVLAPSAGS